MDNTDSGRSPLRGSGCQPTASAAEEASSQSGIPNADELPTVTHEGTVKLGDLEITVLQLSNGERVIDEESLRKLMAALFGDEQSEGTGA